MIDRVVLYMFDEQVCNGSSCYALGVPPPCLREIVLQNRSYSVLYSCILLNRFIGMVQLPGTRRRLGWKNDSMIPTLA